MPRKTTPPDEATATATETPTPKPPARKRANGSTQATASVAQRAFELFVARGGQHGDDLSDWYEAERQMKKRPARSRAAKA